MKHLAFLTLLLTMLFLGTVSAEAANRYVRAGATGANNGSDWTNAYTTINACIAAMVRSTQDTCWVAAGAYGAVAFNKANSGTNILTIRKATVSSHGIDTGWLDSYGNGQAVVTCGSGCFYFSTGYWEVYGATGAGFASTPYGITVHNTTLRGSVTIQIDNETHILLDHIDASNNNDFSGDDGNLQNIIYAPNGGTDLTVQNSYLHSHNGSAGILLIGWNAVKFDHNYTDDNYHKELVVARNVTNFTWKFNVSRNASGTCPWCFESPNGVYFYGNVFYVTDSRHTNTNGLIGVPDGWSVDSANVNVFNNTWVHPFLGNSNEFGDWPACGTCRAANNLFYNVKGLSLGGGWTFRDYSWCGGSFGCSMMSGESNGQVGSGSPFVNLAAGDFRLVAATNAGHTGITAAWANGALDYNLDMNGNTRGADGVWDRGAFEFGGGVANPPPAVPTNVRIQ